MSWALGRNLPVLLDERFPLPLAQPFTSAQAATAGVTRHALARLRSEGFLRRVLRGVYVAAQVPDSILLRAQALALIVPRDAAVTDWTACWVHAGVLPPGDHLTAPPVSIFKFAGKGRLRNALCTSGERTFDATDLMVLEGVTMTTPLRTALDLGRFASRDWAIAGMDSLLRLGHFDKLELVDNVERFKRQRGVVQLRDLAPRTDHRAESPGESVLRLRWTDLPTLPQPQPQIPVLVDGREIYRIDLGVEALRFGVEYDGERYHSSASDQQHDRARRRNLESRFGWLVIPVTKANVFGVGRDVERMIQEGIREARHRMQGLRHAS